MNILNVFNEKSRTKKYQNVSNRSSETKVSKRF
jgi:hypothetical protein